MLILGLGIVFSTFGVKPIQIIQFAQIANGLLLPVIAALLIWLANRSVILGSYRNGKIKNIISILILIITLILGFKSIFKVLEIL